MTGVDRLQPGYVIEDIGELCGEAPFLGGRELQTCEAGDVPDIFQSKRHGGPIIAERILEEPFNRRLAPKVENPLGTIEYNGPAHRLRTASRRRISLNAIEVQHLRRIYKVTLGVVRRKTKEVVAVEDISFEVSHGELFGLLGPNGAGKTTTVKMLTTLLLPSGGQASVLGHDIVAQPEQIRSRIGFIFGGERGLYWRLTGLDNLRYFASLYHVDPDVSAKRIPYLLEMVGLDTRSNEKVEGYSRGMKQRLHIARTLLHDPEVLFLDEPTIGLDPVGARELRQVVRDLQSEKKTILLTTHYMFEADSLCDRIAVINHGRIVAMDTPEGLKRNVSDLSVIEIEVYGVADETVERLRRVASVAAVSVENRDQKQALLVHSPLGSEAVPGLLAELNGMRVGKVSVREPTLEDAYVRLVGEPG
jgi:ABC-2 type transport system ATP-binding protein